MLRSGVQPNTWAAQRPPKVIRGLLNMIHRTCAILWGLARSSTMGKCRGYQVATSRASDHFVAVAHHNLPTKSQNPRPSNRNSQQPALVGFRIAIASYGHPPAKQRPNAMQLSNVVYIIIQQGGVKLSRFRALFATQVMPATRAQHR